MSPRRHWRLCARRRARARRYTPYSLYRRALRYEALENRRLLAVVTVNTLSDTTDFNDGLTTLREAIFATNIVPGADTIDFAPSLTANGPAKIILTQGEIKITDSLTISGPGANLLTIDASGSDPTPTIKDGLGSRVFYISDGPIKTFIDVSISGLAMTGGDTAQFSRGGAIFSFENLTVTNSAIFDNSAGGTGGGIAAEFNTSIVDSTITGNLAGAGGGIQGRNVTVADSTISGNSRAFRAAVSPPNTYR